MLGEGLSLCLPKHSFAQRRGIKCLLCTRVREWRGQPPFLIELRTHWDTDDSGRARKPPLPSSPFVSAPHRSWVCPHSTVEEAEAASVAKSKETTPGPAAPSVLCPEGSWEHASDFPERRQCVCALGGGPLSPPLPRPEAAARPGRGRSWRRRGGGGRPRPGRAGGRTRGQAREPAEPEDGRRRRPGTPGM